MWGYTEKEEGAKIGLGQMSVFRGTECQVSQVLPRFTFFFTGFLFFNVLFNFQNSGCFCN